MGNKEKGNQAEREAKAILEADGYVVHRALPAYRPMGPGRHINVQTDVFGCDIIAKRHGQRTRFIQVKHGNQITKAIMQLANVPWDAQFDSVEVWEKLRRRHPTDKRRVEWYFRIRFREYNYAIEKAKEVIIHA